MCAYPYINYAYPCISYKYGASSSIISKTFTDVCTFLENIVVQNKDKDIIKVAVASFLPLERSLKLLDKRNSDKLQIIGQNYENADYLFTNNISEVDKNFNDKYKIPANFIKIDEFILDGIIVYQVFKKQD